MGGKLDTTVARLRVAVRQTLQQHHRAAHAGPIIIALSGGADSLALTAAAGFVAAQQKLSLRCAIVDHGLQPDSALVAAQAAAQAAALGCPATVLPIQVSQNGEGLEAAARSARYQALAAYCATQRSRLLLTAHTQNDQAEQVLLALARGSGTQSLAGIPPHRNLQSPDGWELTVARPLLEITRAETEAACRAAALSWWQDPHNSNPQFLRSRVRQELLPQLQHILGSDIIANLARTAELAQQDAAVLSAITAREIAAHVQLGDAVGSTPHKIVIAVSALQQQPAAIAGRMIRAIAQQLGSYYSHQHVRTVTKLIDHWNGQKPLNLPGTTVRRENGQLIFEKTDTINAQPKK